MATELAPAQKSVIRINLCERKNIPQNGRNQALQFRHRETDYPKGTSRELISSLGQFSVRRGEKKPVKSALASHQTIWYCARTLAILGRRQLTNKRAATGLLSGRTSGPTDRHGGGAGISAGVVTEQRGRGADPGARGAALVSQSGVHWHYHTLYGEVTVERHVYQTSAGRNPLSLEEACQLSFASATPLLAEVLSFKVSTMTPTTWRKTWPSRARPQPELHQQTAQRVGQLAKKRTRWDVRSRSRNGRYARLPRVWMARRSPWENTTRKRCAARLPSMMAKAAVGDPIPGRDARKRKGSLLSGSPGGGAG